MNRIYIVLLLIGFSSTAQINISTGGIQTTCSEIFVDSGGLLGDYLPNENYEITICPEGGPGNYIQFEFIEFVASFSSSLIFYEGIGTDGNIINRFDAGGFPLELDCAFGVGVTGIYTASSDPSGCVTVTFTTMDMDTSGGWAGWVANITCTTTPGGDAINCCPVLKGLDPTCGIDDGEIKISFLLPNTVYTISYNDPLPQSVTLTSDDSGVTSIRGLFAGTYTNIDLGVVGCTPKTVILNDNLPSAGTDGETSICDDSTTIINLFDILTDEDSGGIWDRVGGTGGVFDAVAGTFLPALGATTSVFDYGITNGSGSCPVDTSKVTITISGVLSAGIDGETSICDDSTTIINLFDLITGEDLGGTWTRLTGTGGVFNEIAGTFSPVLGATTSIFDYGITNGSGSCPADTSKVTITISGVLSAGIDGEISICDDSTTIINLFDLITGEDLGGTWTRLTGTGGVFNEIVGTFSPTLGATKSTFEYAVGGNGSCIENTSTATIYINEVPFITSISSVCSQDFSSYDVMLSLSSTNVIVTSSVGTVVGDTIANIPLGTNVTITVSSSLNQSCTSIFNFTSPDCTCSLIEPPIVNNETICFGSPVPSLTVKLPVNPPTGDSVNWYDAAIGGTLLQNGGLSFLPNQTEAGVYTFYVESIQLSSGCFSERIPVTLTITESAIIDDFNVNVLTNAFSENSIVEVIYSGNDSYEYNIDGGSFQKSKVFNNVSHGLHLITVRNGIDSGCEEIILEVCVVGYPEFFTPNFDGFNDTWNISDGNCIEVEKLIIFDRYGKLLKELNPNGSGWDGTYNGNYLPSNDYWFRIVYIENGIEKVFKNHFSLKR